MRLVWGPHAVLTRAGADWIVLPGSKHTSADLAWLRARAWTDTVAAHVQRRAGAVLEHLATACRCWARR